MVQREAGRWAAGILGFAKAVPLPPLTNCSGGTIFVSGVSALEIIR